MRSSFRWALLLMLLALSGCAGATFSDFYGKQNSLETAQKRYTELVRWGELPMASAFVDPDLRADYLKTAAALDRIRFTDFESGPIDFEDGDDSASVIVVYHAYSLVTLIETKILETQEWYREDDRSNTWRVRPDLQLIVAEVSGTH